MAYGRRRAEPVLDERVARRILDSAWAVGIRGFDTAEGYGSAVTRLSDWLIAEARLSASQISTKLLLRDVTVPARVKAACERFAGAESLVLLSHGSLETDRFVKMKGLAELYGAFAGQSLYAAAEVARAVQAGAARVQVPVNVLDSRQLEAAQNLHVPLDARSVFLQGLLLETPESAEGRVPGSGSIVARVQSAAMDCGLTPAAALLAAVLARLGPRDRVVIGVDAPRQVEVVREALDAPAGSIADFRSALKSVQAPAAGEFRVLDPRTWARSP
jgi:aryl-alcohol dehydrogenase-like predicted oxidoreductase